MSLYDTRPRSVYFARSAANGLIKIGCSTNVASRIKKLAYHERAKIDLLAQARGEPWDERAIHAAFMTDWHHSEWFKPSTDILSFIDCVRISGIPDKYRGTPPRWIDCQFISGTPNPIPRKNGWTAEARERASLSHKASWKQRRAQQSHSPVFAKSEAA